MEAREQQILTTMVEAANKIAQMDEAIEVMENGVSTESYRERRGLAHAIGLLSDIRSEGVKMLVAAAEMLVEDED